MAINATYLLGAGASFNAIPTVNHFAKDVRSLSSLITRLNEADIIKNKTVSIDSKLQKNLTDDLDFLSEQTFSFSSPDTYVKNLFLQGNKEGKIDKFKRILSLYLVTRHYLSGDLTSFTHKPLNLDRRYVPFFASILESGNLGPKLPENVNMISWNYDFQVEIALKLFKPSLDSVEATQRYFQSIHHLENVSKKIIHLNGMAGLFREPSNSRYLIPRREQGDNDIEYLADIINKFYPYYKDSSSSISDSLTFAWEIGGHERIENSKKILSNTQVLVVIGYSFPFFNREIDNQLISSFIKNNEVNEIHHLKIYLQDPLANEDQIEILRERFEIPYEIEIQPIRSVEQFFLPPQL